MLNNMKGTSQDIDFAGNSNPDKILAGKISNGFRFDSN